MKNINVSWGNFEAIHTDVTNIFEQLCRILFKKQFLDDTSVLTSSPNHPGVEAAPNYSTKLGKNIAFQAKYFVNRVDYSQIRKSVDKTLRECSEELDIFFLYCNKDLTLTSNAYKEIESDLQSADIELKVVSNNEILNQITQDSSLQQYFFGNHTISREWFSEYNKLSFSSMNERYNTRFNVKTEINDAFELFTRNPKAITRINEKKTKFIEDVNKLYTLRNVDEIIKIKKIITSLDDITHGNIGEYLAWNNHLRSESSLEIEKLKKRKNDLERQLAEDKGVDSDYFNTNKYKIRDIDKFLEYICSFGCTEQEKLLITEKFIVVDGEAGMGKSQLFATTVNEIMNDGGYALLLLGQHYLADNDITAQIMERFGFDYGFCEFLDILDVIGENENKDVYIFIDAINETPNKNVWKNGLTRIMSEIDKRKHIKLVLSVRTGYEQIVFEEKTLQQIQDEKIFKITQSGFLNEPVVATKEFLNFYNIPFSPSDLLNYEMTNPLFLTLFCKTYNGEEMNIFQMFERVISIVDKEIQTELEIWDSGELLKYLLSEIAQHQLNNDNNFLYEREFLRMDFWSDYGIFYNKKLFIAVLLRSGLLVENVNKDKIVYSFGYNLFEDYLKAKKIMKYSSEKKEIKEHIEKELLKIEDGKIQKIYNIGIFLFICCFYFKKFNEDCIDLIEKVTDESDSHNLATRYLKSFSWRPLDTLNSENFINIVKTYRIRTSEVLDILIENSVKENSPINAEFLHEILFSKKLNERDASWTIYINRLTYEDERIFQLIYLFNEGGSINNLSKKKLKLLLTLFTWLLSSSNRKLRDVTSKAMIEILKINFDLCEYLLRKFENVDDPYIIQRLYGIIFGACTKKNNPYENEYKSLSKFVYSSVFDKDLVYPDILLRDYARLIIEKFLVEFPKNKFKIEYTKIVPPYSSEPIATVKFGTYSDDNVQRDGLERIEASMRPEGVEMYGDFGRYTFQSALNYFEGVDIVNLYHYAMQYIRDKLGYSNELFADYDTSYVHHPLDRVGNHIIERIGKKYQWITFYNILARISDSYKLKENYWDFPHPNNYSGPWEPYVRDFDPTLNLNFMKPLDILPEFNIRYHESFIENNWDDKKIQEWIAKKPELFDKPLSYTDSKGIEWVLLYQFKEIKDEQTVVNNKYPDFSINNQQIWRKVQAYFVKNSEFQKLKDNINIHQFFGGNFPEASSTYQLYSREFGWSPSIKSLLGDYWHDFKVKTGEENIERQKVADIIIDDTGEAYIPILIEKEEEITIKQEKTIAKIQPAHIRFSWEEEYDVSKEEQIYFNIPCFEIINKLQLHSKEYDGYFFSQSGNLVAFDGKLTNNINGLVIRKDYLDSFLKENDLSLFWTCIGEKKCFDDHRIQEQSYSEWSGFYYLNNQSISGEIEKIRTSDLKS